MPRTGSCIIFLLPWILLGSGCVSEAGTRSAGFTVAPFGSRSYQYIAVNGVAVLPSAEATESFARMLRQGGYEARAAAVEAAARTRKVAPWNPTDADVAAVERTLGRFLEKADRRMLGLAGPGMPAKAPHALSHYYMRYTGIVLDGRVLIACRGSADDPASGRFTFGAGTNAFNAVYDVKKRSIVEFGYDAGL